VDRQNFLQTLELVGPGPCFCQQNSSKLPTGRCYRKSSFIMAPVPVRLSGFLDRVTAAHTDVNYQSIPLLPPITVRNRLLVENRGVFTRPSHPLSQHVCCARDETELALGCGTRIIHHIPLLYSDSETKGPPLRENTEACRGLPDSSEHQQVGCRLLQVVLRSAHLTIWTGKLILSTWRILTIQVFSDGLCQGKRLNSSEIASVFGSTKT